MSWQVRLAYELVKPRRSKALYTLQMALAAALVLWGLVVCILITLAPIAVIFDL